MAVRGSHDANDEPSLYEITPAQAVSVQDWGVFTPDEFAYRNGTWNAKNGGSVEWKLPMREGTWDATLQGNKGSLTMNVDGTEVIRPSLSLSGLLTDTVVSGIDHSGNNYSLTTWVDGGPTEATGLATEETGRFGRAYRFSADRYVRTASSLSALAYTGEFSATWVGNVHAFGPGVDLFSFGEDGLTSGAEQMPYKIRFLSDGRVEYVTILPNSSYQTLTSTKTATLGLNRVVVIRTDSTLSIWVNDELFIDSVSYTTPKAVTTASLQYFSVGGTRVNDSTAGMIDADIHEVRVWSSAKESDLLLSVVDSNDLTYRYTREGTEIGCWFMEEPSNAYMFNDRSGTSYNLTEVGTLQPVFGRGKYGSGLTNFTTGNYARSGAVDLLTQGTCTFMGAFEYDGTNGGYIFQSHSLLGATDTDHFALHVTGGDVIINAEGANGTDVAYTQVIASGLTAGLHAVWVAVDDTAKTITWNVNGTTGTATYTTNVSNNLDNPSTMVGVKRSGASTQSQAFGGTIYAIYWDSANDHSTKSDEMDKYVNRFSPFHINGVDVPWEVIYQFDYLDYTHDSAEQGFDLTTVGSPTEVWSGERGFNAGVALDGINDYFEVDNDANLVHGGDETVFIRFKATDATEMYMCSTANPGQLTSAYDQMRCAMSAGAIRLSVGNGTVSEAVNSSNTYTNGEDSVGIFIRDVTTGELKVRLNGTETVSSLTLTPLVSGVTRFRIGQLAGSGNFPFDGVIYDVRIMNRVPTAEEIADYEAGAIDNLNPFGDEVAAWGFGTPSTQFIQKESTSDYTESRHDLTEVSGPFTQSASPTKGFGAGRSLDGVSDYWDVADDVDFAISGSDSLAVLCRLNVANKTNNVDHNVFTTGNGAASTPSATSDEFVFVINEDSGAPWLFLGNGTTVDVIEGNGDLRGVDATTIAYYDAGAGQGVVRNKGQTPSTETLSITPGGVSNLKARIGSTYSSNPASFMTEGSIYDMIVLPRVPTSQEIADYEAGTLTASNAPSDAIAAWGFGSHMLSPPANLFEDGDFIQSLTIDGSSEHTIQIASDTAELNRIILRRTGS